MNKIKNFLIFILSIFLILNIGQIFTLKFLAKDMSLSLKLFDEISIYQEKILKSNIDISQLIAENEEVINRLNILQQNTKKMTGVISDIKDKNKEMEYYERRIAVIDKEIADKIKNEMIMTINDLNKEIEGISKTTYKINETTSSVIKRKKELLKITKRKTKILKMLP